MLRFTQFIAIWSIVAALAAAAVLGIYFWRRADAEVRARVEQFLIERYPSLTVAVGSARLEAGKGISIRDVSLVDRGDDGAASRSELAFADEIIVHCDLAWEKLLARQVHAERVTIRRPLLRAVCHRDGRWNVTNLVPQPCPGQRPVPIQVEDATLEVIDHRKTTSSLITLRDIDLALWPIAPEGNASSDSTSRQWAFRASLRGNPFQQATFTGRYDQASQKWFVDGAVEELQLNSALRDSLPLEAVAALASLEHLRARGDFQWRILGKGRSIVDTPMIRGRLYEGRLEDPSLPFPIHEIQTQLEVDRKGWRLRELSATFGQAQIRVPIVEGNGWVHPRIDRMEGTVTSLMWDQRLVGLLPTDWQTVCERLQPSGLIDGQWVLRREGDRWQPAGEVTCRDVQLQPRQFPYSLQGVRGKLQFAADRIGGDLHAQLNGGTIRVQADIHNPGGQWQGWLKTDSLDPIQVDQRLVDALKIYHDRAARIVEAFHARGRVMFSANLAREGSPHSPLRSGLEITVQEGELQHDKFRYPLRKVAGKIRFVDGRWTFREFHGENDSAYVTCQGEWAPVPGGGLLSLDLGATDVPLEDELRVALHARAQQFWNDLRPAGVIDQVKVNLRQYAGQPALLDIHAEKWAPQGNIEGRAISVYPVWFPYRIDRLTGQVRLDPQGNCVFELAGAHEIAKVQMQGGGAFHPDGRWRMTMNSLQVRRLALDHELQQALPAGARDALAALHVTGPPVAVSGKMEFARNSPAHPQLDSRWDLRVDVDGIHLNCGLPVRDVFGHVSLIGNQRVAESGKVDPPISRGELHLESAMFGQVQLTDVTGPVRFDRQRVQLGYQLPSQEDTAAGRYLYAKTFGGTLQWVGNITLGAEPKFTLQLAYENGDLNRIAAELTNQWQQLRGRVYAYLRISGVANRSETYEGIGQLLLREADIYELPVMVALLKIFSNKPPDRTAFTTSDINFEVQGDHIYLRLIDLQGDAISLIGEGEVRLDRTLDLKLSSIVGREQLYWPILRPLVGEAARRSLEIRVTGTIDAPETTTRVLPGLGDTLEQLIPEQQRRPEQNRRTVSP